MRGGLAIAALIGLAACGQQKLPGYLWDLKVADPVDDCHPDNPYPYTGPQDMEYRIEFDGSKATLALGPDVFATGDISGCQINYESVVWGEPRDGYDVKWQLKGDATFRFGGSECNIDHDWIGTETFEIVSTDHPDLEAGCTYTIDLQGDYAGPSDGQGT